MTDAAGVEATLADRPDLEPALQSVLEVDERHDTWTYEDLPIGSGPFGELVSRDIVVAADGDAYRLADPAAVRAALEGTTSPETDGEGGVGVDSPSFELPDVDRTTTLLVAGALAVVALVRLIPVGSVYRDGAVVLSGNDPYYYRYWVEQVSEASAGAADVGALSALPVSVQQGEPLTVATLWWIAELLGGTAGAIGHVLAWYPVVSAVLTAAFLYLLAVRTTGDRRVGLAAVLVLAILPGHALRTSLGFADHHAFDYPWLAATALLLVVLATVDRDRLTSVRTALASLGLGVAVTGQVLAWEAGPLLVVPVGLVVLTRALVDVRAGRSPLVAGAPVAAGLGVAAALTWAVHAAVGWHTTVVAAVPALLFAGVLGLLGVAALVHRTSGDVRHLLAADAVTVVAGVGVVAVVLPDVLATVVERLAFLFGSHEAVETHSLLDPSSFEFLLLFGLTLVLAVPTMVLAVRRAASDGRWLVPTVYAWYCFALATVQVRFVGELGAFAALFAGLGFVHVAAWVDVIDPVRDGSVAGGVRERASERLPALRLPNRRTVGALLALFVLFGAFGGLQTAIKVDQIATEDATYETAVAIDEYAVERGQTYPENYVLSRWGYNRVYNSVVNGEAASYAYAERTYADFLRGTDLDRWHDRLRDRVGYVVIESQDSPPESVHARLYDAYGGRGVGDVAGSGHFRAIYVHDDGARKAYALVPGARLTGTAGANETVSATTNVSVPGADFTYERETTANATGTFALRVAYPGEYTVRTGDGARTVSVPERAVENGTAATA